MSILKLHDVIERRRYKAGSLICPQSKNSPINFDYIEYYNEENVVFNGNSQNDGNLDDDSDSVSPFK